MTIDRVESGDPLSAGCQNELIDQVNALACPGAVGQAQYGTAGITFHGPPQTQLAIFELLSALSFPDLDGAPTGYFDREPTPFAQAAMVWCNQYQATDVTADGTPIRSYSSAYSGQVTVWQPGARRTGDGTNLAYNTPAFRAGDRVYCLWNRQSGRWEILSDGFPWFIRYAVVQPGHVNFLMSGFFPYVSNARSVPLMYCDQYGNNEWGEVEDFPLPSLGDTPERPPSVSPALFPGDVVMLGRDCTGQLVILDFGAHVDAAGGTVRMMATPGIPRGWSAFTPLTGRFPLGAGGEFALGASGGGDHRHAADTTTFTTVTVQPWSGIGGANVLTGWQETLGAQALPGGSGVGPGIQPFNAVQFIQRTS
jgi:hypothetical protein